MKLTSARSRRAPSPQYTLKRAPVTFTAVANTPYHIAVDGYNGASGTVTLHISALTIMSVPTPSPTGADNIENATTVNNVNMPVVNNASASAQMTEPSHGVGSPARSVWWVWTPISSGSVTIDTSGSSFDTLLAVYSGASPFVSFAGLTTVASNDDAGGTRQSSVTFMAMANTSYYIAVDGYLGATGDIHLHLSDLLGASLPINY